MNLSHDKYLGIIANNKLNVIETSFNITNNLIIGEAEQLLIDGFKLFFHTHKTFNIEEGRIILHKIQYNKDFHYNLIVYFNDFKTSIDNSEQIKLNRLFKKNQRRAIKKFTQAIKIKPDYKYAFLLRGLAKCIYNRPKLGKSLFDFTRVIEIDPKFSYGYYLRGKTYLKCYKHDMAITDICKAIELDKSNSLFYMFRGACYALKASRYIKISKVKYLYLAIDDYTKASELEPDDSKFHYDWVSLREKARKELEDLIEYFKNQLITYNEKIALSPDHYGFYLLRSCAKLALQDYEGAKSDYKIGVNLPRLFMMDSDKLLIVRIMKENFPDVEHK